MRLWQTNPVSFENQKDTAGPVLRLKTPSFFGMFSCDPRCRSSVRLSPAAPAANRCFSKKYSPNIAPVSYTHLISAEPGIYLPGKLGVRIEDVIILTEDGCRNLTRAPKELLVL